MADEKDTDQDHSFIPTILAIRYGLFVDELSAHMAELVGAVREAGRSGKLTITLTVKPFNGDATALTLEDTVKMTRPSPQKGQTVFFANASNVLQRNDPRQPELSGLRKLPEVVPAAAREVHTV